MSAHMFEMENKSQDMTAHFKYLKPYHREGGLFFGPEWGLSVKTTGRQLWPTVIIVMGIHVEKLWGIWVHSWRSILIWVLEGYT